jgi:hypothetical protein
MRISLNKKNDSDRVKFEFKLAYMEQCATVKIQSSEIITPLHMWKPSLFWIDTCHGNSPRAAGGADSSLPPMYVKSLGRP